MMEHFDDWSPKVAKELGRNLEVNPFSAEDLLHLSEMHGGHLEPRDAAMQLFKGRTPLG
jgi:hypothetical protein